MFNYITEKIKDRYAHKICVDCEDLVITFSKLENTQYPNDVEWKKLFIHICRYLCINKTSALVLWNEIGQNNNWKHLHLTEEEKTYTENNWKHLFIGELMYCCDRWSFDRLLRTQWAYRQWQNKVSETYWEELKPYVKI